MKLLTIAVKLFSIRISIILNPVFINYFRPIINLNIKTMKTTREEAKENIHDNLVDNLQGLLEKNYDAEKGFKKAVENAKNSQLKEFLK